MGPGPGRASPAAAGGGRAAAPEAARRAPKGALPTTGAPDEVTFEDVAVGFSAEEWSLLEGSQRDLHQEVMLEMRSLLLSLGHSVPTLDFSSLICQPEGTAESPSPTWGRRLPFAAGRDKAHCEEPPFSEDVERLWKLEQDPAEECLTTASSGEGRDQSSHHLCALMKLVKEIPEFLCGHANASLGRTTPAGGTEGRGHAGPAVQMKSPPCFSRQGALAGLVSLSLSSRPGTPTSSTEGEWPEPSRRGTPAPCAAQGLTGADVATHAEPVAKENLAKGQLEGEAGVFPQRPHLSTELKGSPQTDPRLELCPTDADGTAGETAERTLASKGRTGGRDQQDGAVPLSATDRDRDQAPTGAGERSLEDLPPAGLGCLDRAGCWREGGADGPLSPGALWSISRPGSGSEEGKTVPEAAAEREAPNSACEASLKLVPEAAADEKPLQGLLKCLKELIILQPCPAHPAPRKPSAGRRQQVPGGRQREGRSSSLPVQVKTEASTEEPGVCRPRGGSGPPAASWGHTSPSPAEASRRVNSPGRKEGARFPAVKTEQVASSPPGQDPERATGFAVVHAGGSGEGAPDGPGTPAIRVKSEAAEEEPPLQGRKNVSEEKGCPHFGLPRSGLSLGARESGSKLGLWVPYSADWSPATSPLHGLLNCLKDIPVPRPLPPQVLAGKRGAAGEKERRKGGRRGRIGPPPNAFLPQGPEAGLGEKPAQQPLLPLGYANGIRGRDPGWKKLETTMVQGGLGIPLQGQEGDLKQHPPSAQMQPCSPAVSSSISSSPDRVPWWTPEDSKWRRKEDELGQAHSPLQSLRRGLKERPLSLHSQASSPATSSSPDGLQRWTPEPIQWARREEGLGQNSTPLQGLEKCLKDIQNQRWSPAVSSSLNSSPDRLRQWTPEPVRWARKEEGASPLGIPPLQGLENCLKEIARSRDFLPDTSPAGHSVCAQKQQGTEAESPRPWPGESLLQQCAPSISASTSMELAAKNSPLHRLMNCLKEIPTQRPSYLNTPSVSSASASSSSSSSSSSCSETERDQQSPGSTAWWDCSQGWHQLPDTFQGSEMDALVGQKVMMESKRKHPSVHHPPEDEERLPSIQESKFVDVGDKAPSASLLGNLENDAKDTVVKQMLSSRDPPLCSRAQQDATSGAPEARDDGTPSAPLADKIFTHELQKGPRDPAPVQTPTCSSTPAPESPDNRTPEGGTDWSLAEAQVQPQPGPKEGGTESSPLQGLLRCLKEITYGSTSPCSPPARKRPRESRHGQPHPEEEAADSKKKSWEGAVPSSPPVCGVEMCPQRNGHACPLSTRSSAHKRDPPGWSNSASLRMGTKRAPAAARDEGSPAPGAAPAPDDAAQDAPRKKKRPGPRAPSPPPPPPPPPSPCSCGGGPPGGAGPLLSKQLGRLAADVGALCRDLSRLRGHVLGLEREARGRALELAALRLENRGLSRYARRLEGRCRALETRSRRHRLRLLGLPEGAEGGDAAAFLRRALPALLGWGAAAPALEVEGARRARGGGARQPPGRPRPLLFRLPRPADKAAVLEAARARALRYAGARVSILPDRCASRAPRWRGSGWVAGLLFGAPPAAWGRVAEPLPGGGRAAAPSRGPRGGGCEPAGP